MNSTALLLPSVIVPVLSKIKISQSPAASIPLPDFAIILYLPNRVIPATPIAGSSPPIVVGINATNSATKVAMSVLYPRKYAENNNVPITVIKIRDKPAKSIVKSYFVLCFGSV